MNLSDNARYTRVGVFCQENYVLILGKVGQNLKFPALVELMKKLSELGVPHGQFP